MTDKKPDFIAGLSNGDIPIFTLGDLRQMNTSIPESMRDAPDSAIMVLPRKLANKVFDQALIEWGILPEEAATFKDTAGAFEVMRTLQISHLLRCAQGSGEASVNWILVGNRHFKGQTPWGVIRKGGIDRVLTLLYGIIFFPESPYFVSFAEEDRDV